MSKVPASMHSAACLHMSSSEHGFKLSSVLRDINIAGVLRWP